MVQSGYTEARDDSREKNEEGQGNKPTVRRCFSYSRTMVIDRREDPLCGYHVIDSLSENGNYLLSTTWSDNG